MPSERVTELMTHPPGVSRERRVTCGDTGVPSSTQRSSRANGRLQEAAPPSRSCPVATWPGAGTAAHRTRRWAVDYCCFSASPGTRMTTLWAAP